MTQDYTPTNENIGRAIDILVAKAIEIAQRQKEKANQKTA